jgi:diguanylate cyclase (GGDEF)-like protein
VGTLGGLNRLIPEDGSFERYTHNPSSPRSLGHNEVRAILEDREGVLWVGTSGGGLSRLDPDRGEFVHYRHDPENPDSLSNDEVRALFEDLDGRLWIGTEEGGVSRFDRETEDFERFLHDPEDPASLSDNLVRSFFQDTQRVLWIGTDGGLDEWVPEREQFLHHVHDPSDPTSLGNNQIMSVYQDRGGVLWVGTQGGVHKWNAASGSFSSYRQDPKRPLHSLSSNLVNAFAEDLEGNLWVATYEGLNRIDHRTGIVTHFRQQPGNPRGLGDERVFSLLVDSRGVLWAGTFAAGLYRLESGGTEFTNFRNDPDNPKSLSSNAVTSIHEDRQGIVWLGTYTGGLNRFSKSEQTFVRYQNDPESVTSVSSNKVVVLTEDTDGILWVGTDGGGLNGFDRQSGTFTHYRHRPRDPSSLSSDTIFALLETSDGTLWIGTRGGGLNRWSLQNRQEHRAVFESYTQEDGLANDVIYSILEDDQGYLWLSTNSGISKFDPGTETCRNFDTTHGLLSKEFNFGAGFVSRTGEMFFGGNQGFNSFFPASIRGNLHVPPIVLTSLLKFNRPVETEVPTSKLDSLEFSYRDYVVSFEFSALDFTAPKKNQYAYKLDGFDNEWNELGNLNRATYTNLDPGSYTLRVKGSNNDGVWNEAGLSVGVRVIPPPWRTWWAYTLYGLGLLGMGALYGRGQRREREKEAEQRKFLEQQVSERTSELAERNADLQRAIDQLELASVTDSLTGLRNRRFLVNNIERDLALVDRYYGDIRRHPEMAATTPRPDYAFLLFDLDGFKEVNDTFGHAAGDRVLVQVRDLLEAVCRQSDTLIRWGGDEFLVVGRHTGRETAERLAERIRQKVESYTFDLGDGQSISLSCSLGFGHYPFLSSSPSFLKWEQIVAVADRALYIAKKSGRNAWVGVYETPTTPQMDPARLLQAINDRPEELVARGQLKLRTSIVAYETLVWAWA